MQFTLMEFKEECGTCGVHLTLVTTEHRKISNQVEMTRRTFCTIKQSLMVNALFFEAYINFSLMYRADHIFSVLPIKDTINKDVEPTTPFKLEMGTKPSV